MSTRSGKRLHNTSNDNIVVTEIEPVLKSERKTRSKRVVEANDDQGIVLKSKRRQNYVSYPAGEEETDVKTLETDIQVKSARALRRNTLKEHNVTEEDTINQAKTVVRQTRRLKKLSETIVEDSSSHSEAVEAIEVVCTQVNGKTKGKKNKKKSKKEEQDVIDKENEKKLSKKKKNKSKKKKSGSLVEQIEAEENRDSNTSNASFHSAAGSPVNNKGIPEVQILSHHTNGEVEVLSNAHSGERKRSSSKIKTPNQNSSVTAMDVDIGTVNTTFDKDIEVNDKGGKRRKSSVKNSTFDIDTKSQENCPVMDITFEKAQESPAVKNIRKSLFKDNHLEVADVPVTRRQSAGKTETAILDTTFEKDDDKDVEIKKSRKSNIKERILEIFSFNASQSTQAIDEANRRSSPRTSLNLSKNKSPLNSTFEVSLKPDNTKPKSPDTTFDKDTKLNTTFDKETKLDSTFDKTEINKPESKSSLISSDTDSNITLDKSDEISKISITDDDSKENIINTTPLLIESSFEISKLEGSLKENQTPESKATAVTPLKREGTFTKDGPVASVSPKQTPSKRLTIPAAGCTPYHSDRKGSQRKKSVMNLTHSVEKTDGRSPLAEAPRATRVMFCSPVNNAAVVNQRKSKIIKSNLKGSNKSFVFEESDSVTRLGRKRSFTHSDADDSRAKRSRIAEPRPAPRPPRARTASAMAKLSTSSPQKSATPAKPKSDVKATKLPNFAALHARRFDRMESLDECQERRAKRARQLLEPTGKLTVLERSSPRVTIGSPKNKDSPKPATPAKLKLPPAPKLPTLDTLQRGYTRFGFKMNCDVNPFSVQAKPAEKPKEIKPKGISTVLKRQPTQPSLVGATSLRRVVAQKTVMREKSFTLTEKRDEKRKESRTIIKGVRTNRRFELQMKSRNINM